MQMHAWQTLGRASPGCSGHGVKHTGFLLYLGWVSTRYPSVGLVTNANLEASGTQFTKWVLHWDLLLAVVAQYLWEPHHSSRASRETSVCLGDPCFHCWPGQGRIGVLCLSGDNGLVWLVSSRCTDRALVGTCRWGIETQQLEEWAMTGALAKRVVKVSMGGVLIYIS